MTRPPHPQRARRLIMAGVDQIAKGIRAKASASLAEHITQCIDWAVLYLQDQPDSYFIEKLRGADSVTAAAQQVWDEVSKIVLAKGLRAADTPSKGVH